MYSCDNDSLGIDVGQHLELRAILIGFLVLEAGLTGNILNTLVRRE